MLNELHRGSSAGARVAPAVLSVASAVLVPILPKCPPCMGIYLAAISGLGATALPLEHVWPATWVSLALVLGLVFQGSLRTRRFAPLLCASAGACVLVLGRLLEAPIAVIAIGAALLVVGSVWSVAQRSAGRARRRCEA